MIEPITLFSTIAGAASVASKLSIDLTKLIANIKSVPAQLTQVSNELISLAATLTSLQARFNPLATSYTEDQLSTLNTVVENTRETLLALMKIVDNSKGRKWGRVKWIINAEEVGGYRNGLVAYTTMLGLLTATLADQRAASTEAMVARVLLILEGNDLSPRRTLTTSLSEPQASPPPTYTEQPSQPRRQSTDTDKPAKKKAPKAPKASSSDVSTNISTSSTKSSDDIAGTISHKLDFEGRWIVREIRINGSFLGAGTLYLKNDGARRRVTVVIRLDSSKSSRLVYRWLDRTIFKRTKQGGWTTGPSYGLQKLGRGDDDVGEVNIRLEDVSPLAGQRSLLIAVNLIKQLPSEWLQLYPTWEDNFLPDFIIDDKFPPSPPLTPVQVPFASNPLPSPRLPSKKTTTTPRVRQTKSQVITPAATPRPKQKPPTLRSQTVVTALPQSLQVGSPPVPNVRFEEDLRGARERYRVPGSFVVDMSTVDEWRQNNATPGLPPKPVEYRAVSGGRSEVGTRSRKELLRAAKSSTDLAAARSSMRGGEEERQIGMQTLEIKRKGGWFRFGS